MKKYAIMLAMFVACAGVGCGSGNNGTELETDDPEGKEDSVLRPAAGTYWLIGEPTSGYFEFILLKSDKTFIASKAVRCGNPVTDPCRPLDLSGTYRFTKSGSKRYVRLLDSSNVLIGRYEYRVKDEELSLALAEGAGRNWFDLTCSRQPDDAWCDLPTDCTLQGLPQPECAGEWKCESNEKDPPLQFCSYNCEVSETPCGGKLGETCADDEFCDFENESCGSSDQSGVCVKRPLGCKAYDEPVCGCDNQTYGNACYAKMAGVDVQSYGPCN